MSEPKKRKAFSVVEKADILAHVDSSKKTCYTGSKLGIALPSLNAVVKNK